MYCENTTRDCMDFGMKMSKYIGVVRRVLLFFLVTSPDTFVISLYSTRDAFEEKFFPLKKSVFQEDLSRSEQYIRFVEIFLCVLFDVSIHDLKLQVRVRVKFIGNLPAEYYEARSTEKVNSNYAIYQDLIQVSICLKEYS
ncbi:hypothetical protein J3Q64DRAFT_1819030 [Phycomyces blakesleeanus]|uniref:Uncharacterized protein n=2 Tax=Phycomyces blakesleeanus TaxID=4837 RepID=A0A162UNP2_PHYB8|nr:hypothetical protein PHYBLDRAFT_63158 [Phycomyces blakesleeanus NRRL 1555(-)]OAD76633.1 hypothetical protein PHYBLDRAFT_63158 [Phycomyces blakesleeanus NRRL 1555(-)]|eukprot:XP_018294673.1 hypothetical protein PHYBLDRAFT_63158 [Phycomyces blakesleeanus NRRL 1555(-)]